MPVATGIVNENSADANALNIRRAEANIKKKAIMTCIFAKKLIQSLIPFSVYPLNFSLISAAPDTLRIAYREQYSIALIILVGFNDLINNKHRPLPAGIQCAPKIFGNNSKRDVRNSKADQ